MLKKIDYFVDRSISKVNIKDNKAIKTEVSKTVLKNGISV